MKKIKAQTAAIQTSMAQMSETIACFIRVEECARAVSIAYRALPTALEGTITDLEKALYALDQTRRSHDHT